MGAGSIDGAGDGAAGTKPMSIAGRVLRERERLSGMSPEERAWRKQWLKDQVLSPNEPRYIHELEKEYYNPIRRLYRAPLNIAARALSPLIGQDAAQVFRFYTGRASLIFAGILGAWYLIKYNHQTWVSKSGWRIIQARPAIYPGEPGYGQPIKEKEPSDYIDRGFKASVLNKRKDKDGVC